MKFDFWGGRLRACGPCAARFVAIAAIGRDTRLSAVYGPSAGHTSALFFVFALYLMMMENDVV